VKKRRGGRWLGALAGLVGLTAGAVGAALLLRRKGEGERSKSIYPEYNRRETDRWARPGMPVTFRAELMPGREASERTFRVKELLPSDRILLDGVAGEHARGEFERVR
jgi:hypothetical protein